MCLHVSLNPAALGVCRGGHESDPQWMCILVCPCPTCSCRGRGRGQSQAGEDGGWCRCSCGPSGRGGSRGCWVGRWCRRGCRCVPACACVCLRVPACACVCLCVSVCVCVCLCAPARRPQCVVCGLPKPPVEWCRSRLRLSCDHNSVRSLHSSHRAQVLLPRCPSAMWLSPPAPSWPTWW